MWRHTQVADAIVTSLVTALSTTVFFRLRIHIVAAMAGCVIFVGGILFFLLRAR